MAYTDYVNVADPANWDEPQSGILPYSFSAFGRTLADIKTLRVDTLASKWNGTRYADVYQPMVFQFLAPVVVSDLWVDTINDNSYQSLWCYGIDDGLLFGGPLSSFNYGDRIEVLNPDNPDGPPRSFIYRVTPPTDSPIKAFVLADDNAYPQGSPQQVYGVYGTLLGGDPPPPPPFWTGFTKTFEVA